MFRKWKLGEHFLLETDKYKYLGTFISRSNKDNLHIEETIKKTNKIIAYIKSVLDNQEDFNRVYFGDLLWKIIGLPTLNYASSVWLSNNKIIIEKLENLQLQMARIILKAPRNVAKEALLGDLGWQSIATIQNKYRISYFNRIKNLEEARWPKLLGKALLEVGSNTKWKWANNIKDLLNKCNLSEHYNMDFNNYWLRNFIYQNACNNNKEWFEKARDKSSLSDYIKCKIQPGLENYLLDKVSFVGVNLKFRARTNTLDLEGKKRSWSDKHTGLCKICECKTIEDLNHFLFDCSSLKHIRDNCLLLLQNDLESWGLTSYWNLFHDGSNELKRDLLLNDLSHVFPSIVNDIFDFHCKQLLVYCIKERNILLSKLPPQQV